MAAQTCDSLHVDLQVPPVVEHLTNCCYLDLSFDFGLLSADFDRVSDQRESRLAKCTQLRASLCGKRTMSQLTRRAIATLLDLAAVLEDKTGEHPVIIWHCEMEEILSLK